MAAACLTATASSSKTTAACWAHRVPAVLALRRIAPGCGCHWGGGGGCGWRFGRVSAAPHCSGLRRVASVCGTHGGLTGGGGCAELAVRPSLRDGGSEVRRCVCVRAPLFHALRVDPSGVIKYWPAAASAAPGASSKRTSMSCTGQSALLSPPAACSMRLLRVLTPIHASVSLARDGRAAAGHPLTAVYWCRRTGYEPN